MKIRYTHYSDTIEVWVDMEGEAVNSSVLNYNVTTLKPEESSDYSWFYFLFPEKLEFDTDVSPQQQADYMREMLTHSHTTDDFS